MNRNKMKPGDEAHLQQALTVTPQNHFSFWEKIILTVDKL